MPVEKKPPRRKGTSPDESSTVTRAPPGESQASGSLPRPAAARPATVAAPVTAPKPAVAAKPATAAAPAPITPTPRGPIGPTTTDLDRQKRIAHEAYLIAERRGFAPGSEVEDWLEAERSLERKSG